MTTATEIQMMMAEGSKRHAEKMEIIRQKWLAPMIDRTMAILFGPRRKRWDRYGAYHRRQLKKWTKKNKLEIRL